MCLPDNQEDDLGKIAIVGLATKTPAGSGLDELYTALLRNDSFVQSVKYGDEDDEEEKPFGYASVLPDRLRHGFDVKFWGMTPTQACDLDPQTRWILEGVHNAVLDSRYWDYTKLTASTGRVGVYCGIMNSDAMLARNSTNNSHFSLNAASGAVAGTVSHILGFTGPCLDVNTMCSSGTVCFELACEALKNGSIDVAVVAAANYVGGPGSFINIASVQALSPTGLEDSMGTNPDGYVRGEAMVVVLLQRAQDLKPQQKVRGIVEAVASTHHGNGVVSTGATISTNTALPVLSTYVNSYQKCFVNGSDGKPTATTKDDVVYLELHATGTARGDKAEVKSVREFYASDRQSSGDNKNLWLGSNKSIFGHTEPVSGLLSMAKILLAFERNIMPPTMMVSDPSPSLEELTATRKVNVVQTPLAMEIIQDGIFGLTASGMSGTTTHILLRKPHRMTGQPDELSPAQVQRWPLLATVHAHSADACKKWRTAIDQSWQLGQQPSWGHQDLMIGNEDSLPQVQRVRNQNQAACVTAVSFGQDHMESERRSWFGGLPAVRNLPVVILPNPGKQLAPVTLGFGGVGLAQYGVGRRAYAEWPSFREAVKKVDKLFQTNADFPIFAGQSVAQQCGMIPPTTDACVHKETKEQEPTSTPATVGDELSTELMQPTTFLVQYAQAVALVKDFDTQVESVVGHSFGELVAAAVAGAITVEAAVTITLARTQVCMKIERDNLTDPMGMVLCIGVSYNDMNSAIQEYIQEDVRTKIFVSGVLAKSETLLSGSRKFLERFCEHLRGSRADMSALWVESSVAFHCPFVREVASEMETVVDRLIDKGQLFDCDDEQVSSTGMFMSSLGYAVDAAVVRTSQFWSDSLLKPILLQEVMETVQSSSGGGSRPHLIDLSPRGLFVNWTRRNPSEAGMLVKHTISAPVFSWDFVRVLQHYRPSQVLTGGSVSQTPPMSLPKYSFAAGIARPVPKGNPLVVPHKNKDASNSSTYLQKTCFETKFVPVNYSAESAASKLGSVVGVNLVSPFDSLWAEVLDNKNALLSADDIGSLTSRDDIRDTTLIVSGPLKGKPSLKGFDDPLCIKAAIDFVDVLQHLLVQESTLITGIIFITEDAGHPAFEFVVGSFATLRLQIKHLQFVSTVYLKGGSNKSASSALNRETLGAVLAAAKQGETTLQMSESGDLSGMRLLPVSRALEYEAGWVRQDCLYVITGSTSAVAQPLLPYLAGIGVKHFLLLLNRTEPSKNLIEEVYQHGAATVTLAKCDSSDCTSIEEKITSALAITGAKRVAGVFHVAAVDDQEIALPVPKFRIEKIAKVKYYGQVALLNACKLQAGDIFSVPGSISTIVGSGGIGYAATNYACRALQVRLADLLLTPYPTLGASELSRNTRLWNIDTAVLRKRLRVIGIGSCSSQVFNLGMTNSVAIPTGNVDTILCRLIPRLMDGYMNSTAPCLLFSALCRMEESTSNISLEDIVMKPVGGGNALKSTQDLTASAPISVKVLDAEDALIMSISDIVGLTQEKVRQLATPDSFLDEAFSIDSLSSIRLAKRIEKLGFKVGSDTIVSSTYGALLSELKASEKLVVYPVTNRANQDDEDPTVAKLSSVEGTLGAGELPVSLEDMLYASQGHDLHSGGIVPSWWYAMNGLLFMNTTNVKVTLLRMSSMDIREATVTNSAATERTVLTFQTAVGNSTESYIRANVATNGEALSPVPAKDLSKLTPDFVATSDDIYNKWCPRGGFAYKKDYQMLQKYEAYGKINPDSKDCFFADGPVSAEANIPLPSDATTKSLAKSFFLVIDSAAQALFVGLGGTIAPAKEIVTLHLPLQSWLDRLQSANGKVQVHAKYDSMHPARLDGKATTYLEDGTPLCTLYLVAKPTPAVIGSRIYPQFWLRDPVHTLVCFHIAGGTSQDFNSMADFGAQHGLRVLSCDFVRHGRRFQQPDEDLITSFAAFEDDVMPWLSKMLQGQPFSLLGVSAGGACAFALARDSLVRRHGLTPCALVTIMSQPPFLPNPHVERTWDCTIDNIEQFLHYYSTLAGKNLLEYFGHDYAAAADRTRSVQSVMHELTTSPAMKDCQLDVPMFTFGLETDTVVDWNVLPRWSEVCTSKSWDTAGGRIRPLDNSLNHFISMSGRAEEVYRHVLLDDTDGVMKELFLLGSKQRSSGA